MPRSQPIFMIDRMDLTSVLDSPACVDFDISASLLSPPHDNSTVSVTVTTVIGPGTVTDVTEIEAFVPMPMRTARCADGNGTLSGLFFSDDDVDIARAKAICRRCPLADSCLDGALDRNEAYGVWGGVLLIDGEAARFPVRRGRPSKTARIEYVADEVLIPEHLVA